MLVIALHVAEKFWCPIMLPRGRLVRNLALVGVPEAPVYEDDFLAFREDEIRSPRESVNVQSVAISHSMNEASDDEFWRGIFALDAAHVLATRRCGKAIHCRLSPAYLDRAGQRS